MCVCVCVAGFLVMMAQRRWVFPLTAGRESCDIHVNDDRRAKKELLEWAATAMQSGDRILAYERYNFMNNNGYGKSRNAVVVVVAYVCCT